MSTTPVVSDALRDDLHLESLVALNHAESLYRALQRADAALLGLHSDTLTDLTHRAKTAYDTLAALRIATDWRRKS